MCTESSTYSHFFLILLSGPSASEGFEVARLGDARVALIGFPSVGKSTLQCQLTGTESEAAEYEFTTLTCIPGTMHYKKSKMHLHVLFNNRRAGTLVHELGHYVESPLRRYLPRVACINDEKDEGGGGIYIIAVVICLRSIIVTSSDSGSWTYSPKKSHNPTTNEFLRWSN